MYNPFIYIYIYIYIYKTRRIQTIIYSRNNNIIIINIIYNAIKFVQIYSNNNNNRNRKNYRQTSNMLNPSKMNLLTDLAV